MIEFQSTAKSIVEGIEGIVVLFAIPELWIFNSKFLN